jgi:hypothetical protein
MTTFGKPLGKLKVIVMVFLNYRHQKMVSGSAELLSASEK